MKGILQIGLEYLKRVLIILGVLITVPAIALYTADSKVFNAIPTHQIYTELTLFFAPVISTLILIGILNIVGHYIRQYRKKELKGIGGWLAVYVISLLISSGMVSLNLTNNILSTTSSSVWVKGILIVNLGFPLLILTSILCKPSKLNKPILFSKIYHFLLCVYFAYMLTTFYGIYTIKDQMIGLFSNLLWLLYWTYSNRVKNTYLIKSQEV